MNTLVILTGQTEGKELKALTAEYTRRSAHYIPLTVTELRTRSEGMTHEQQCKKEGEEILRLLRDSDYVVLLDERGREYRSVEFASALQGWLLHPRGKRLVFIIGGPFGFSEQVRERASEEMSLSRMTFSHQMVRVIFLEQLYRALTIIRGEHYHHE